MDQIKFCDLLGIKSKSKRATPFKLPGDDGRIFSNYFTYVIVENEGHQRLLKPMRYRVRPHGSKEEIPARYNVFNARIDALETRQTWGPLFMKNHGLVPFTGFYEWVPDPDPDPERKGKSKLISFYPSSEKDGAGGDEIMWAPCLWDEWSSIDGSIQFKSFAIITDDPPAEIKRMGHDRCPIFLRKELISSWLNPQKLKKNEVYEVLRGKEEKIFLHKWA